MALKIRTFFLYVSISFVALYLIFLPNISISSDHLRRLRPYADTNQIINEPQQQYDYDPITTATGEPSQLIQLQTSNSIQINDADNHMIQFKPRPSHIRNIPVEIQGTLTTALYNKYNISIVTEFDHVKSVLDTENLRNDSMSVFLKADSTIKTVSVLFPSWEVLVIVSSENGDDQNNTSFFCLFDTNEISPARFSGTMSYPDRKTFMCRLPKRFLRRLPFRQPVLTKTPDQDKLIYQPLLYPAPELLRWNFIVYDIIETEDDVVLFAKGFNNRQGVNRRPTEFNCVFGDDTVNGVTTSVTSSMQEVFRCRRPDLTEFSQNPVRVSLVILETNQVVPSVAYYTPKRKIETGGTRSLLCACTMVYNVAKFLKEWVIYHSEIGVDKFILYDNGSDDDFDRVVYNLKSKGYDIETRFWLWPKTQEGGFSHVVLLAKTLCSWMMFIDVDEFIYSPSWTSSKPSKSLLQSLLPTHPYGQIIISCYEFGPSKQKTHPLTGVTQGYNCRKEIENRHKSIVLLDAVHESLLNVIHHFKLKDGYKSKKVNVTAVVNHYKFQAWTEFKTKFRRRVSAYVVDWTRSVNLKSNDRAPGLGYHAVEPKGWEQRFCEVYDNRLKQLTRRWFGARKGRSRFPMVWQNI
ncbi:hypothetical protein R6Q57_003102 [Mikania cordata]